MGLVDRRLGLMLVGAGIGATIVSHRGALADPPTPQGSGSSCVVTGNAYAQKDLGIFSAATGGAKIGTFSGAITPLKAASFPADASQGRMLVNTASGFRIEGFADPRGVPVFATRDLPVVAGHVWISGGRSLKVAGAVPGQLRVEMPARGALSQPLQATALCDAFSFSRPTPPVFEVPRNARGYVAQRGSLELYGSSNGDLVYTLQLTGEGNGLLLWSTESRGQYVHVISRFELFVDAWVKKSDVRALPQGEMMDQVAPPEYIQNPPVLGLKDFQRIVQAPKAATIRATRGDTGTPIGEVESGAEVYVLDVIIGWASVLPKALHVMPPDDKAFWVKASDLGIQTPDAGPPK